MRLKSTIRRGLSDLCVQTGVVAMQEIFQHELDRLVGPRYRHLVVIMFDGVEACASSVVTALGIDVDGRKHVLGVHEGATESAAVVKSLLDDLIERGPDPKGSSLFVIDGSKALRKAITSFFGKTAAIRRCTIHKMRNVLDHLPDERRPLVRSALREAFRCDSASEGRQLLKTLATKLEKEFPGAAASLREGLDDLFTVVDLGIRGRLRRFLQTTNAIENLFSSFRHVSRKVKRWRSGSMVLRWVATALTHAAAKFRRVKGYEDLKQLADALKPKAAKEAKRA